jgi:hypothetical protein
MVSEHVSLSCELLEHGMESWWLTRENGQGPICWELSAGRPLQTCGGGSICVRPKAYVVVKAALGTRGAINATKWKYALFGELSRETLHVAMEQIIRWLRRVPTVAQDCEGRGLLVQALFDRMDAGLFSCVCEDCDVRHACYNLNIQAGKFVVQDKFQGAYPRGHEHWFTGISAAAGDVAHQQLPWLSCYCGSGRQYCSVM